MFDWIGDVVQAITLWALIANYPGILMILGGAGIAGLLAWKHFQRSSQWRFSPRQVMDLGLGAVVLYLLGMETWLIVWWEGCAGFGHTWSQWRAVGKVVAGGGFEPATFGL